MQSEQNKAEGNGQQARESERELIESGINREDKWVKIQKKKEKKRTQQK